MKWKRPSGNPITTNDNKATIDYCESLGWTQIAEKKAPAKKAARKKVVKK